MGDLARERFDQGSAQTGKLRYRLVVAELSVMAFGIAKSQTNHSCFPPIFQKIISTFIKLDHETLIYW